MPASQGANRRVEWLIPSVGCLGGASGAVYPKYPKTRHRLAAPVKSPKNRHRGATWVVPAGMSRLGAEETCNIASFLRIAEQC